MTKSLIRLLCLVAALSSPLLAQHTFPALDTNNTFTGVNTFPSLNGTLWLGTSTYPCTAAGLASAIAALPAVGGEIHGEGCTGGTLASNFFGSNTKPLHIILGLGTWSVSSGITIVPTPGTVLEGIESSVGGTALATTISCAGIATDCFSIANSPLSLKHLNITGPGKASGGGNNGLHFTGGTEFHFEDVNVGNFGNNCWYIDSSVAGIAQFSGYGELVGHDCGNDGWKNLDTVNQQAFNVASIQHLELYNNGNHGYESVGTRSVNGTCNNAVTFGVLRAVNNTGDNAVWTNDCDQRVVLSENEGSGGWGVTIDANSVDIDLGFLDMSTNTSGNLNINAAAKRIYYFGLTFFPHFIGSEIQAKRFQANQGATALALGNFALSAGWGTTANVTGISGSDQSVTFTVNATGTGQAANPTITLTFADGSWGGSPGCLSGRGDGNSPANIPLTQTVFSATAPVLTFYGTPVAGTSYTFTANCMGR